MLKNNEIPKSPIIEYPLGTHYLGEIDYVPAAINVPGKALYIIDINNPGASLDFSAMVEMVGVLDGARLSFRKTGVANLTFTDTEGKTYLVSEMNGILTLIWNAEEVRYDVDGAFTPISNFKVSSISTVTTGSLIYVPVAGMSITPGAGTYKATFSSSWGNTAAGTTQNIAFHVDGTIVADSERSRVHNVFFGSNNIESVVSDDIITVLAGQTITVDRKVSAGVGSLLPHTFTLIKLS